MQQHLVEYAQEGQAAVHEHAVGQRVLNESLQLRVDGGGGAGGQDRHEDVVAVQRLCTSRVTCHASGVTCHT